MPESTPTPFPFESPKSVDPAPAAARLLTECPVARVRLASGADAYLVTGYDDVRTVYTDPRFSRAAGAVPGMPTVMPGTQGMPALFNMDPPDHTRLRRLIAKAFAKSNVAALQPRVAAIVAGLLDTMIEEGTPADLRARLAAPLPVTVICDLLGVPADDRPTLYDWVIAVSGVEPASQEVIGRTTGQAYERLVDLSERRRRAPADDLLTALVHVHDEGDRLTHEELLTTVLLLFGAGQETTCNHLMLSVLTLCQHRDQWDLLVKTPDLVPGAVEELLRFIRLADTSLSRVARVDVELSTDTVPAGASVFVLTSTANRDPSVFQQPELLDVTRQDANRHIAFGQGVHYCLGAPLARLELKTALTGLVTRLPELRLAIAESEIRWNDRTITGGLHAFPVTW